MESEENIKIKNVWISKNITLFQAPHNTIQKSLVLTSKHDKQVVVDDRKRSVLNYDTNGFKTPITKFYNRLTSNSSLSNLQGREAGNLFVISSENALNKTSKNIKQRFTKSSMAKRNSRHPNHPKLQIKRSEEAQAWLDNYIQATYK